MATLIGITGPYAGHTIPIKMSALRMGRAEECELMIDDGSVSGTHGRISEVNGQWILEDLGSSNGTTLNGADVRSAALKDGDVFALGTVEFRFQADKPAPPRAAPPAPAAPALALAPAAAAPVPAPKPAPPLSMPPPRSAPAPTKVPALSLPAGSATATAEELALVQKMSEYANAIRQEAAKVIIGQVEVLEQILMCIMANGHALLVGLPGLAKTTIISTLAKVLHLDFKRIQFTPDLMPSDITGTEILETDRDTGEKGFRFLPGPIFANLLLADEINRTPPKTQAALLEAMQEKRVTVGNQTYHLDPPFFVLATQNPIEQEGTYPLPEAQMDRFMLNIWVDYPSEDEEERIIAATTVRRTSQPVPVLSKEQVLHLQQVVEKIPVSPHIIKYATHLVRATRPADPRAPDFIKQNVSCGAGPRAGQALIMAAKARAVLEGRIHVGCSDVRRAAIPVLRHRIFTNFAADSEGLTPMMLIERLVKAVPEPTEKDYAPAS